MLTSICPNKDSIAVDFSVGGQIWHIVWGNIRTVFLGYRGKGNTGYVRGPLNLV